LEEEFEEDRDYYISRVTLEAFETEGVDSELVEILRLALGDREDMEILCPGLKQGRLHEAANPSRAIAAKWERDPWHTSGSGSGVPRQRRHRRRRGLADRNSAGNAIYLKLRESGVRSCR